VYCSKKINTIKCSNCKTSKKIEHFIKNDCKIMKTCNRCRELGKNKTKFDFKFKYTNNNQYYYINQ